MSPEQILLLIKDLPLNEALSVLVVHKIYNLSKKGYESIRRLIRDKVSEKRFGFVPNKDESNYLVRIAERKYFKEFGWVLPKHKYSDFLRVGYLIAHLNKMGGANNRKRVQEIRDSISLCPNGAVHMRIVTFVTTGAIAPIINYLSELKKQSYTDDYITDSFDELVRSWKTYSFFVKSTTSSQQISDMITKKMGQKQQLIMIFSYGEKAKNSATQAVAEILKDLSLNEDYFYESKNNNEGEKEVHTSTFILMDTFE